MTINKYYNLGKHKLFPICRSITGEGIRKTLKLIKNQFSQLQIKHTNSSTPIFDWKIPYEWNIKDAYVLDSNNNKIINFKKK